MRGKQIFLAIVFLASMPSALVAQDYAFQGFAAADVLGQMHQSVRDATLNPSGGKRSTGNGVAISTAYKASPAISANVRRQFVDSVNEVSGKEAARKVLSALEAGDPVASWAGIVRGDGLRSGDVADAMAAYWILNWMIANRSDNNKSQAVGVRDQMRRVMGNNPGFVRLNDAGRQEIAEVLILHFLAQHAAYVDALKRGDEALLQRLSTAAIKRFKNEMKLDPRRISLTNAGFS